MGAVTPETCSFAVNKYLHTVACVGFLFTLKSWVPLTAILSSDISVSFVPFWRIITNSPGVNVLWKQQQSKRKFWISTFQDIICNFDFYLQHIISNMCRHTALMFRWWLCLLYAPTFEIQKPFIFTGLSLPVNKMKCFS